MSKTLISIQFSAETAEDADKFLKDVLVEQIDHTYYWHSIDNMVHKDTKHLYVSLTAHFQVKTEYLGIIIEQVNHILHNVIDPSLQSLYDQLCYTKSVGIFLEEKGDPEQVNECLYYLLSKVNQVSEENLKLVYQNATISEMLGSLQAQVNMLQSQYAGLQSFLMTGIEIKTLRDVVIELAARVDPDIIKNQYFKPETIQ